jgi:hypothetical protein
MEEEKDRLLGTIKILKERMNTLYKDVDIEYENNDPLDMIKFAADEVKSACNLALKHIEIQRTYLRLGGT